MLVRPVTDTSHPPERDPLVLDEALADGGLVLYHQGQRELMTLNPTAALVWEYCDGQHDEAAITAEVQAVFPQVSTIVEDVQAILVDLRAHGMLRPVPVEP